jgi:hypothetical protein
MNFGVRNALKLTYEHLAVKKIFPGATPPGPPREGRGRGREGEGEGRGRGGGGGGGGGKGEKGLRAGRRRVKGWGKGKGKKGEREGRKGRGKGREEKGRDLIKCAVEKFSYFKACFAFMSLNVLST